MARGQRRAGLNAARWLLVAFFVASAAAGVLAQSADAESAATKVSSVSVSVRDRVCHVLCCAATGREREYSNAQMGGNHAWLAAQARKRGVC